MSFAEDLRIRAGDVLIAGAGQIGESTLFGRAIIADARLTGKLASGDIMVLRFEHPLSDLALYVYAFLLTTTGLKGLRATAYGTSIPRLRPDLLAALPIPIPDPPVLRVVATLVRRCVEQREIYLRELDQSCSVLAGLEPRFVANTALYDRAAWMHSFSNSATSLAARNHRLQHQWSSGSIPLRSVLLTEPRKANRFARTTCEPQFGTRFFGQRDLFLIRPIPQTIRTPASVDGLRAEKGSIIVAAAGQSGEGTLFGRCELGEHFAPDLVSEHTLHLLVDPKAIDLHYLFGVLRTPWGVAALKSCGTGTSVPSLTPSLLNELKIPRFDSAVEDDVARHIRAAYQARKEASVAEAEAIRIIEEEVLPSWLT